MDKGENEKVNGRGRKGGWEEEIWFYLNHSRSTLFSQEPCCLTSYRANHFGDTGAGPEWRDTSEVGPQGSSALSESSLTLQSLSAAHLTKYLRKGRLSLRIKESWNQDTHVALVAPSVKPSSQYAKVVGSIPGQGPIRSNQ